MANVVVSALATWNGKALKKAKQDVNVFDKQLKSLARTLGFTFSATAIVAFSKKAVKAFAEDQAAAKSLQLQLENTGNAFRATEVEDYIKNLEKTYAILTDLRAPFQTLLNVTGSVDLAQRSLEAALDISAGTGQSLATVVGAISAGVRGQTKAIRGLNTGIDENILATGDMNKIMEELERRFSGQASARLGTYAGKMDMLKKSADEATKAIGEGIVDALVILSKDKSIENLADNFENLGDNIAFAIKELAKLVRGFNDLVNNPSFKAGLLALAILSRNSKAVAAAFTIVGGSAAAGLATKDFGKGSSQLGGTRQLSRELMISTLLTKARKREYDIINQKNAIENKNLEELKKKFDLERIGITQALNVATDDETKVRLKAQLAILDNNEAMAKKLLAELEAYEALKKLADAANKAAEALSTHPDKYDQMIKVLIDQFRGLGLSIQESMALAGMSARYQAQADALSRSQTIMPPATTAYDVLSGLGVTTQDLSNTGYRYDPLSGLRATERDIRITIDTAAGGDRLSQAIAESIQVATRNGYSTVPAGQGF